MDQKFTLRFILQSSAESQRVQTCSTYQLEGPRGTLKRVNLFTTQHFHIDYLPSSCRELCKPNRSQPRKSPIRKMFPLKQGHTCDCAPADFRYHSSMNSADCTPHSLVERGHITSCICFR
ncbi:hypothetical protein ILYODFUR_017409 [Ilyodon furcidens]|uniref:Uncharacterized protein n=1 Tax=Ilyodon furcidens TaxID=33524 RepID=A0ABV0UI89_9TELE